VTTNLSQKFNLHNLEKLPKKYNGSTCCKLTSTMDICTS